MEVGPIALRVRRSAEQYKVMSRRIGSVFSSSGKAPACSPDEPVRVRPFSTRSAKWLAGAALMIAMTSSIAVYYHRMYWRLCEALCAREWTWFSGPACVVQGRGYRDGGELVEKNVAHAYDLFSRSCDVFDSQVGCTARAYLVDQGLHKLPGISIEEAHAWALNQYKHAATVGGVPEAYFNLGVAYEATDLAKAKDAYRDAAEGGYADAYDSLFRLLLNELGSQQDPDRVTELDRIGRKGSDQGSRRLALRWANWLLSRGQTDQARALYAKLCPDDKKVDKKVADPFTPACHGRVLTDPNLSPALALRLEEKACSGQDPDPGACLALSLRYERGEGVSPDRSKAQQISSNTCEALEDGLNCFNAGRLAEQMKDYPRAYASYEKGCRYRHHDPSCQRMEIVAPYSRGS